jgi:hypothetical protein
MNFGQLHVVRWTVHIGGSARGYLGVGGASQQPRYGLLDGRLFCIFIHRPTWTECPLLPSTGSSTAGLARDLAMPGGQSTAPNSASRGQRLTGKSLTESDPSLRISARVAAWSASVPSVSARCSVQNWLIGRTLVDAGCTRGRDKFGVWLRSGRGCGNFWTCIATTRRPRGAACVRLACPARGPIMPRTRRS